MAGMVANLKLARLELKTVSNNMFSMSDLTLYFSQSSPLMYFLPFFTNPYKCKNIKIMKA